MASRLERLFVLLESGSSNVTRRAAAQQLGEVQRLRPHELHRLLNRVYALIHSPAWETRIAAGQAFEAILRHVPQWNPEPYEVKKEEKPSEETHNDLGRLRFDSFDIEKVISQGAHLMGSEGKEYEYEDKTSASDLREKLNRQRQQLNARLGLDKISLLSMDDMNEMVTCHDLTFKVNENCSEDDGRKPIGELVPLGAKLSSREMNRARRKARQQKIIPDDSSISKEEPEKKKFKPDASTKLEEYMTYFGEWVPEPDGTWNSDIELWPLEGLACALATDLFSSQWETRHGAATALRELLRSHGAGAGKETGCTSTEMEEMHQIWLEDISLRLLCVLALDRFGDFVSDQVVAPVRETCAQCLGVAVSLIGPRGITQVASFLNILTQDQSHWEGRHGALLGFKYILAVQQELGLKSEVFPAVIRALWDPVEDIAAAAARALIPVTGLLMQCIPTVIPLIVGRLRRLLLTHDELGAACGCYMSLLAALLAEPNIKIILGSKYMASVIPRLWPYLSHPTSSVRKSALQTLQTITKCSTDNGAEQETSSSKSDDDAIDVDLIILNKEKIKHDCIDKLGFEFDDADSIDDEDVQWNAALLQNALRHIFQRVLVEHIYDIKVMIEEVWKNLIRSSKLEHLLTAACPFMSTWICLAMQPAKIPFEFNQLIHCKQCTGGQANPDWLEEVTNVNDRALMRKFYIGGSETVSYTVRENNVLLTRCMAARMLGILSCYIIKPAPNVVYLPDADMPIDHYIKILLVYVTSKSAIQRLIMGLMISHWAKLDANIQDRSGDFSEHLITCLTQPIYFDEIAITCSKILQDAGDFVALMNHYKVPLEMNETYNIRSLEQVISMTSQYSEQLLCRTKLKSKVAQMLEERRKSVLTAAIQCSNDQNSYSISNMAAIASACVNLKIIPVKINPIIKPLMESIKREESECLQQIAADNLAPLLSQCVDRVPCPNVKVLNNLCAFLKSDFDFTPRIIEQNNEKAGMTRDLLSEKYDNKHGILTLMTQQKNIERAVYKKSSNGNTTPLPRGPGRPPLTDFPVEELFPLEDEAYKLLRIQRRGATFAFISLTVYFGEQLPEKLPKLWEIIIQPLEGEACDNENISAAEGEEIISCLQVLEVVIPHIHKSLLPRILNNLERLTSLLENTYKAIRHMASRCIAALADIDAATVMHMIVNKVIPLLGVIDSDIKRQGASEVLACIIDKLQLNIVPYSVLLVVPLLGRMSDHDDAVRLMCTHCFATLIQFMPLDGAIKEQSVLSEELKAQRIKDTLFLQQLFNPKTIGDYKVPVAISAEIRSYQQAGINWLAFLNKYKLHGVLCDDMGLGKTLQSICMIAGDHYDREKNYVKTKSGDCAPLPSLVICPPTLTGHWVYEVNKFLPNKYLTPLHYTGPPIERDRLKMKLKNHNLVIASYDIVRKDIDFFSRINWNYCVLDEGHIIKNGNTKASKAIKTLVANHRLILSGTPIQNNVLELWSLFDFLMPGLLGTARQFTARYSRPILAARDAKATPQHQEAGALAMEALHRQVLPFLLRRVKEDVLKELPPKITQDYYCELSPLQKRLYEDFSKTHMPNGIGEDVRNHHHIFQALRYLQNVCNHPKLVLTPQHPEYDNITLELSAEKSSLDDINHSAKLPALKQLLLDCGIGLADTNVLSEHRALIFCQLKGMLEVVENDLLKPLLPQVSYLRLDGTVSPSQRQSVVQRFNNDPSIDVLLLTTQVGGLGLNLTGADTVIFVEHDWNPMKDLQAMDRAHRIGQKKVVNVYRLITRGTLEEKIMGLQKFKLHTANTVISGENSSLDTMGTDHLLDLFSCNNKEKSQKTASSATGTAPITMKTILENLPDLWDDNQYEAEYDMDNFVQSLSKK